MEQLDGNILLYLHIPKTAGTTFTGILERCFGEKRVVEINQSDPGFSERLARACQDPQGPKVIRGHYGFGIHRQIPVPATYVTFLRNPIERMISHYYHVLRSPTHYLYSQVKAADMSLEDYVRSDISVELDNGQTRQISGLPEIGQGKCSASMVDQAVENLSSKFFLAGLTERFDETTVLFAKGVPGYRPYYYSRNVAGRDTSAKEVPARIIRLIEERNELDLRLYAHVKRSFESRLTAEGAEFADSVRRFRRANSVFGGALAFTHQAVIKARKVLRKWSRPR